MKEIKRERIVVDVIGYEAVDGTVFKSREECKKYEDTATAVIKERFKKLVVKEMEGIEISNSGMAFFMAAIDEDWYYALVDIKTESDLMTAQMYHKIEGCSALRGFDESMIGKRIIVGIGDGIYPKPKEGKKCQYDECFVYGTIEEQINRYAENLREAFEVSKEA